MFVDGAPVESVMRMRLGRILGNDETDCGPLTGDWTGRWPDTSDKCAPASLHGA